MIDSYVRIFSLHMYAYVSASYDDCFVKIWATCENFLGKWFTAPPGKKLPVRLCLKDCPTSVRRAEFRFYKNDVYDLMQVLGFLETFTCYNGLTTPGMYRGIRSESVDRKVLLSP